MTAVDRLHLINNGCCSGVGLQKTAGAGGHQKIEMEGCSWISLVLRYYLSSP